MAFNFLDAVKSYFGDEMISRAANYLGEPVDVIRKGLNVVIPASLAGIVNQAQTGNAQSLSNLANQAYNSGILNQLSDSFRVGGEGVPTLGPSMIGSVFGERFGALANAVSGFIGCKGSTSSSLFGTIVPLALGVLGKHSAENHLAPGDLTSVLSSQKSSILASLPHGFNLSKILGWEGTPVAVVSTSHATAHDTTDKKMFWPFLFGVVGLLAMLLLLRTCDMHPEEMPAAEHDTVVQTKHEATAVATRELVKIKLPNGVELDAYKGGIEDELINFINDPNSKPGKDVWFDFNDLNFKFGTAEIITESRKEIDNIVKILRAYPKVKIKVGGYTDKVGDEAVNKKLSGDRANAVAEELKTAGVGSQVTGAEGYGSAFAKYPADAPEESRIRDRRVSVSVREK